jgi:hypothetical protein
VDKGWYFASNVEKWIIVVALGSPTHELQALVKIEGNPKIDLIINQNTIEPS